MSILNQIKKFYKSEKAAATIIFAFALPAILIMSGIGIEMARLNFVQAQLTQAVDSAAVTAARYELPDMEANARKVFEANFPSSLLGVSIDPQVSWNGDTRIMTVTASGNMPTIIGKYAGIQSLPVFARADVSRKTSGLELVLALDVGGSMAWNGKIVAVRDASKALIDSLYEDQNVRDDTGIGLIPYVAGVNIGTNNKNWLSDPATLNIFPDKSPWVGCVKVGNAYDEFGEESPDIAPPAIKWPVYYAESTLDYREAGANGTWDNDWKLKGNGEVIGGSPSPGNGDGFAQGSGHEITNPIPEGPQGLWRATVGPNRSCMRPMTPLVNDRTILKATIDTYIPEYGAGTIGSQGLIWAARMLSPAWEGKWNVRQPGGNIAVGKKPIHEYTDELNVKAIVIMTDGRNLWGNVPFLADEGDPNPFGTKYGDRFLPGKFGAATLDGVGAKVNQKFARLCQSIKDKGIQIFAVTFWVDPTEEAEVSSIYQACASQPDYYYAADKSADLTDVFLDIAKKLKKIRIVG